MPFTLAHPVAVYPFLKRSYGLSATALIIGSMMPDFEYFSQLREVENIGHHWYGVLPFDLPITLLLCLVFHQIVKKPLIENLPKFLQDRTRNAYGFDFISNSKKRPFVVIVSALIGVITHLLFDGFTHHDGFVVEMVPFFSDVVFVANRPVKIFFLLQLFFSLVGSLLVMYSVYKIKPLDSVISGLSGSIFWWVFVLVYILVFGVRVTYFSNYNTFWGVVMAFLGSFLYALLFASLFEKIRVFRKQKF